MMRIGIDVRALSGASGRRGVGTYIRGLLAGLSAEMAGSADELVLFGNGLEADTALPEGITRVTLRRPLRAITFWDQIAWPPLLAARQVTVFHSPFYAVPRVRLLRCRVVQTIHDLTPLKLPGAVSPRNARIFRMNFNLARSADRVIVPSMATRDDVMALLGIPAGRIAVIPEAADITQDEVARAGADPDRVLSRLGIRRRYLLHTGGHDVVKNLPGVLSAFAMLSSQGRELDLVIVGEHGPPTTTLISRAAALGMLDRVKLPGYVPRADLIALYRNAAALVYPSFAEGFGLPVLEAMTCGAPVVVSCAGALMEVGGDACLHADPSDSGAIAAAVARILDDETLAATLSANGRARAARFTWRETARKTLQTYREAAA